MFLVVFPLNYYQKILLKTKLFDTFKYEKNNPEWTAGQVWNELGREVMRRKRIYDKEEILLNFRDDKKDTLLWNSGRGKYKQSSLGLNTLRNRITELRKAGLIE